MANKKPKQNKPKTGLARCLELASNKKGLVAAGGRYSQMWNHYTEAVDWKISGKAV